MRLSAFHAAGLTLCVAALSGCVHPSRTCTPCDVPPPGTSQQPPEALPRASHAILPHEPLRRAMEAFLISTPPHMRVLPPEILADAMAAGQVSDLFILDVRPRAEFAAGHLPGSVNIPFKEAGGAEALARLPKEKTLLIVCHTGHTASNLNALLHLFGYRALTLKSGFVAWQKMGGPLSK